MKENIRATNFESNECVILVQSTIKPSTVYVMKHLWIYFQSPCNCDKSLVLFLENAYSIQRTPVWTTLADIDNQMLNNLLKSCRTNYKNELLGNTTTQSNWPFEKSPISHLLADFTIWCHNWIALQIAAWLLHNNRMMSTSPHEETCVAYLTIVQLKTNYTLLLMLTILMVWIPLLAVIKTFRPIYHQYPCW